MSANGKSIGEERAILQTIPKETEPEQKFFPLTKIQKISYRKNFLRILLNEFSKTVFTPFFANTLLSVVALFIEVFCNSKSKIIYFKRFWVAPSSVCCHYTSFFIIPTASAKNSVCSINSFIINI